MNRYIWGVVGVVVFAFVLMALVQVLLPALIVIAALAGIYKFMFGRRW